jgi:predicted small lipoprotein YifL
MRKTLLLLLLIAVAGCGQKGPLYLPDSKKGGAKPPPVQTPPPRTQPESPMGDPPGSR